MLDFLQAFDGILTVCPAIPKRHGLQHILPLENGIDGGINHGDFGLRILFQDQGAGVLRRLHGPAEFRGDADADHGRSFPGKGEKRILVITDRGHGGFWKHALPVNHLLVEIPDINIHVFSQIADIIKGYIKRNYCYVFFTCQLRGQVAGAVADDVKWFSHIDQSFCIYFCFYSIDDT